MPKDKQAADPRRAALELFVESFKKVRHVGKPKPADVTRFREVLAATREAGLKPWLELRNPLEAATDVALTTSAEHVGEGLPMLWREQLRDMRAALGYDAAPPLERPMVEHVCLCWLRLALAELYYSGALSANNTFKAIEHMERRLTVTQKRFNRACEALAKVRRMKLPALQVNVAAEGGRQINVA